jgi:hypothetical protein
MVEVSEWNEIVAGGVIWLALFFRIASTLSLQADYTQMPAECAGRLAIV